MEGVAAGRGTHLMSLCLAKWTTNTGLFATRVVFTWKMGQVQSVTKKGKFHLLFLSFYKLQNVSPS